MLKLIAVLGVLLTISGCTPESPPDLEQLNPPVFKDELAELRLTPTQPLVESEIQLQLTLPDGITPDNSLVRGVSMNMGTIPVRWQQQGNSWRATLFVGACSDPQMTWELVVPLSSSEPEAAQYQDRIRFQFQTQQG